MKNSLTTMSALAFAAAALGLLLSGCGSGTGDSTVDGNVPIAYVKRAESINMNPTGGAPFAAGGDLIIREKSSSSAPDYNITGLITQGQGDVSDPEVSYDGKKIVFSMNCPPANHPGCTGHWNIWEYDMSKGGLTSGTLTPITHTSGDDVDPAYLPAGQGFVFSSNRQTTSKNKQSAGDLPGDPNPNDDHFALDEYERERVFNLHTMDVKGENVKQISVNQSHDRNPVVRPNGDIMFSRWDHVGMRNHFKVFRVKPDGTDMFVLYGAHSEGNSFLHPRDMDPKGKYQGQIVTDLMPLSRTHEGGDLVVVDVANYSEQNTPANPSVSATGGQYPLTGRPLSSGGGVSKYGRVTTPYPLWDGTDRVLVGYTPCQLRKNGVVVLCASLTDAELASVMDDTNTPASEVAKNPIQNNVRPAYAIYMFDPAKQTMVPVATPPTGFIYTDPVAIQARPEPNATQPTTPDPTLLKGGVDTLGNVQDQDYGLLEVRSVYDTDGLGRMGDAVLTAADLAPGCTAAIAKTAPTDPLDTRVQVADLVRMKNPADPAYKCAPARFIRAVRAVAPLTGMTGGRMAIGATDFEPQQILGYAPIEPDGSFKLKVPADTPIGLAVVDAKGRAFQTHTNWIQVRPGEHRTCDGCHSPRRGAALNSGSVVDTVPAALKKDPLMHLPGETLASTRTRIDPALRALVPDMVFADVWADTTQLGITARAPISLRYTNNVDAAGNPTPQEDLATPIPVNGLINYPEHIQPLWSRNRGANTCTACHTDPLKLDLTDNIAGTGRLSSYEELLVGDPLLDSNGLPQFRIEEGVPVVERQPALVNTEASEGDALGMSRKSRLIEILFGETLFAGSDALSYHPNPPAGAPDHSAMLNSAEKRLVSEWIDLGGKYYNNLYASGVVTVAKLTQASFETDVYPIIQSTCAARCHQAIGSSSIPKSTASFRQNRYVLTGDAEGDFNVTLTMISDVCQPDNNYLLSRPSTIPHPAGAVTQMTAVLPKTGADYKKISDWIKTGCP